MGVESIAFRCKKSILIENMLLNCKKFQISNDIHSSAVNIGTFVKY